MESPHNAGMFAQVVEDFATVLGYFTYPAHPGEKCWSAGFMYDRDRQAFYKRLEAYRAALRGSSGGTTAGEPSEDEIAAAYRVLWGGDPISDSPDEVMCPRDADRWAETAATLRAAYAVRAALRAGGAPNQEGT